jgi:hypothetical protein
MSAPIPSITRRTFLKVAISLSATISHWLKHVNSAGVGSATSQSIAYGIGVYGRGSYPGSTSQR